MNLFYEYFNSGIVFSDCLLFLFTEYFSHNCNNWMRLHKVFNLWNICSYADLLVFVVSVVFQRVFLRPVYFQTSATTSELHETYFFIMFFVSSVKLSGSFNLFSFSFSVRPPSLMLPRICPSFLPSLAVLLLCLAASMYRPTAAHSDASNPLLMNLVNGPPAADFGSVH